MNEFLNKIHQLPYFSGQLISTLSILLGAVIAQFIIKRSIILAINQFDDGNDEKDTKLEVRSRTIGQIVGNAVRVVIGVIAFTMILSSWGVNITPILAGAGVIGLAVGFGAQTLVKDVVTGFFIILEDQFNIGDNIEVAGVSGVVKKMNIRTTTLKDTDGKTHIVPNSKITTVTKVKVK